MGTRNEEVQMLKNIADSLTKQDQIMERLGVVENGLKDVLEQLQVTHLGHEEELWGRDFPVEDLMKEKVENE